MVGIIPPGVRPVFRVFSRHRLKSTSANGLLFEH